MRLGRSTRLALKWLKACTSIAAVCGLQLLGVPLIACMQGDDEMNCPNHAQMHAMHSGHSGAHESSGTHIQCTGPCHSLDPMMVLSEAPVPERIQSVLPLGNPVLALVHDNSDPSGFNHPPGVPPPRR